MAEQVHKKAERFVAAEEVVQADSQVLAQQMAWGLVQQRYWLLLLRAAGQNS